MTVEAENKNKTKLWTLHNVRVEEEAIELIELMSTVNNKTRMQMNQCDVVLVQILHV